MTSPNKSDSNAVRETSVEPGQVYRDKDKRMDNRYLRVVQVRSDQKAVCAPCSRDGRYSPYGTQTVVSVKNLRTRFERMVTTNA